MRNVMWGETWARRWGMVLLILAGMPPLAAGQSSDEGAPFLLLPVGASAVAMGRAVTALPGQESAFWNPAGLTGVTSSRVVLLRGEDAAGPSTAASVLFAKPGLGTLGVSYMQIDVGEQALIDEFDNQVGTFNFRDHLLVASAAGQLGAGLNVGVNFKVLQDRISCRGFCDGLATASTGYAVDLGMQWVPRRGVPLRLGAMVAHLGPDFQQKNASQSDPLPTRVRVAAAYDVLHHLKNRQLAGWLTLEVQDRPGYRGGTSVYVGSELVAGATDQLFLRAGYATDPDRLSGAGIGLGLRFDKFELSVAKSLVGSRVGAPEPFTVSLSVAY